MELDAIMLSEISQTEKDKILYDLTHIQNLNKQIEFTDTEKRLVAARNRAWGGGEGEMDEGCQKVQTSSYKIKKS